MGAVWDGGPDEKCVGHTLLPCTSSLVPEVNVLPVPASLGHISRAASPEEESAGLILQTDEKEYDEQQRQKTKPATLRLC